MTKFATLALVSAALGYQFSAVAATSAGDKVRRPARLFVAGDYPDKGVTVTVEDLDRIVANFSTAKNAPVPVKSEHRDSPLDPLGEVAALYRDGNELYGVLVFSSGMDAHIRERGVEHISIGLVRDEEAGFGLKEASLVFTPRVVGAGFLTNAAVEAKLSQFSCQGRLTPALLPHARKLLSAPQVVTFSDGSSADLAAEFEAFLNALPVIQPRGSVADAPLSFTQLGTGGPSEGTKRFAEQFGVDPAKVHANLSHGGAVGRRSAS
jgi:hypothetical protein